MNNFQKQQAAKLLASYITLEEIQKGDDSEKISMTKKDFKEEHENLIKVLESSSKEDDKEEIKEQEKEAKDYGVELEKASTFEKSQSAKLLACYLSEDDIEKAHPVGYINKNGYQKQADGKYKYIGKNKTTNTIESTSPNSMSPEEVELDDVRGQLDILGARRDLNATEERREDKLIARERELENIIFKQKNFPEKKESSEVDTKVTHTANKSFTLRNYNITLNGSPQYRGEVKVKKGDKLNINSQSGSLGDIYTIENLTTGETAKFWSYNYGLPDELKENVDKS